MGSILEGIPRDLPEEMSVGKPGNGVRPRQVSDIGSNSAEVTP